MNVADGGAGYSALDRLGLPDTPATRALLTLLDQTVSRVDRRGRIVGVWPSDRAQEAEFDDTTLTGSVFSEELSIADVVDRDAFERVLSAVDDALESGEPRSIRFTTRSGGRTLHLEGSYAPCGPDEVISVIRDRTAEYEARRSTEHRAALDAMVSECLQALIDGVQTDHAWDEVLTGAMERVAGFFGADAAYLRRFRGPGYVEIVGQWRAPGVDYAPPGTSRAGAGHFPWAARRLAGDPVLVVDKMSGLGPEAAVDVANLLEGGDEGFVWVRVGPPRRPTGLFGLGFADSAPPAPAESYEPLIGFAGTVLALAARREEQLRRGVQRRIFEAIVRGEPIEAVFALVCRLRETGAPGRHCVIWTLDDAGALHPVGSGSTGDLLAGFDPCPVDSPEVDAMTRTQRQWTERAARDPWPVADRLGATAVDLMPLVTGGGDVPTALFAVYDTSRLPRDPAEVSDDPSADLAPSLAMVAIERVTDLAELAHRATHDSLTGLANRDTFLTELGRALESSGPLDRLVAVLYCDVDRFKELNDRLGHATGDRFLVDVGRLVSSSVAGSDVVARLGGDEFAVLLKGLADENDAVVVAERIRSAVRSASSAPGLRAGVSIGVAVSGSASDHAEGLLRDADIAMYQAKSSGRDRIEVFAERIRREARDRDLLGRDLARAIADDAIDVHYQPMVDLGEGALMGFEALARWRHPERGFVSPCEFIPIAESGGLIEPLGDIVLDRALSLASRWDGLDLHVNLSAVQVDTVGCAARVLERIAAHGIPVDRVAMEITESVLLSESTPTVENLGLLTDAGVGLVLDDFGTGYASLTYLRRFPFRGIKVDRSFVAGMEGNAGDTTIVSMVLALATSLGLEVIAEGVETAGQEALLREMGCRFVQGFRYSVPVAADGVGSLVERFTGHHG